MPMVTNVHFTRRTKDMKRISYLNNEGYSDPTAFIALTNILKKEALKRKVDKMHARIESAELKEAIAAVHENPTSFHFSSEMDMIVQIVLKDADFQYFTIRQLELIKKLQDADIGLVLTIPDMQKRKKALEWYYLKIKEA